MEAASRRNYACDSLGKVDSRRLDNPPGSNTCSIAGRYPGLAGTAEYAFDHEQGAVVVQIAIPLSRVRAAWQL